MFGKYETMLASAALLVVAALPASATVFSAWQVANVPWGDTLNVRKYPSSRSQKQSAYPNGTILAMTGRCTNGLNLFNIESLPDWQKAQAVRYRWCEVWHDPAHDGNYVTGWVYGRYIAPM
ncbi:MAG: SH3 domain-containing protein [Rhizobiaceae bacterium]|nr:SH3 domain-containing protein [Rhizobiaceae bacterium]